MSFSTFDLASIESEVFATEKVKNDDSYEGFFRIEEDRYFDRQSRFAKNFISQVQFQYHKESDDDSSSSDLRDRIDEPPSQKSDKDVITHLSEQNAALRQYLERFDTISRVLQMENFEYSPEVWDTVVSLCKSCSY